jgi:hypothetical protein
MPFDSRLEDPRVIANLDAFARANSFPDLYRAYSWKRDSYAHGFSDIHRLESRLTQSDRTSGLSLDDIRAVTAWGAMRNQTRISGPPLIAPRDTFHTRTGVAVPSLEAQPLIPLVTIAGQVKGIGPTYISKILRFALPQEYGAIDTRCVRVFGFGDSEARQHNWIELHARNDGHGWYIPKAQARWPDSYDVWINILRYFAMVLPPNCPQPATFIESGLRQQGRWECADVEMALFSYASAHM